MEIVVDRDDVPERGTVVVPVGHDGALSAAADKLDRRSAGLLRRALALAEGGVKHGRIVDLLLPAGLTLDRLLLLPLGKAEGVSRLELEQAGGALGQKLMQLRVREATLAPPDGLELGLPGGEVSAALALGAQLRCYRFTRYRSTVAGEDDDPVVERLRVLSDDDAGMAPACALAAAVARARGLVSEPGNVLTPRAFAERCAALAELGV